MIFIFNWAELNTGSRDSVSLFSFGLYIINQAQLL